MEDFQEQETPPPSRQAEGEDYKLRQFEWFEVETKVRKLVSEYMQPQLRKMTLDRQIVQECNNQLDKTKKDVQNLRDLIELNSQGMLIFKQIDKKIEQYRFESQQNLFLMNQQIDSFSKTISDIKYNEELNQEEFKNLLKYKEIMSDNVGQVTDNFRNMNTNIEQLTSKLNERLNNMEINNQLEQDKISNDTKFNHTILKDVQQQQKFLDENFQNNMKQQQELVQVQGSQKSRLEILEDQMKNISHNLQHTKKIVYKIDDLQQYIKELESYIQMYSPLYVQGQISDTLHAVLTNNQSKSLIQYEEKLFKQMSQKILFGGDEQLKKSKGEAQNYIEDLIKNNRNFIISQKYSNQSEIEQSNQLVIQPEKKVNTEENQDQIEMIENIQKNIKNQYIIQKKQLDEKQEKLLDRVNEIEQNFQQQIFVIKNNFDDQKNQLTNLNQLLQVQMGYNENQKRNVWMEMDKLVLNFNSMSETVNKILQFSALVNQLMIQEEIDKNQMSLYGTREDSTSSQKNMKMQIATYFNTNDDKKNQIKQNFSLDINCISCSGQTEILNKLFKIACLAYHPSPIQVDGKMYRRDEIIEMITKVLQSAKQEYNIPKNKNIVVNTASLAKQQQNIYKSQQGSFHQQNQLLPNLQTKPLKKQLHRRERISTQNYNSNSKHLFLNASII